MGYAILALTVLLGAVVIALLSSKKNGQDPREPPLAPEALPIIGHVRGLMKERYEFYPRISKLVRSPIFTVLMPGQKMYVVTSPDLISKVQKKHVMLAFAPIRAKFSTIICGVTAATKKIAYTNMNLLEGDWGLDFDSHAAWRRGLKPGVELDKMNRVMLQNLADSLDRQQLAADSNGTLKLYHWLRTVMTDAATDSIYGPANPFKNRSVFDAFWRFEEHMMSLLVMPLPRLLVKSGVEAREKCARAIHQYCMDGGLKTASSFLNVRHTAWKQHDIADIDVARYEVAAAQAALVNTVPASFWMMTYIFSDPQLLSDLRAEIDAATVLSTAQDGAIIRTLNVTSLKNQCPLLISTFQEMLRVIAVGNSVREVLEDTLLDDQWLLKKGALVQMPIRIIHTDENLWGSDVNEFKARRFLKGEKQLTANGRRPNDLCFRSFGGGLHLCPGRHFATNEVLAVASLFISRYDITPTSSGGVWTYPSTLKTNAASVLKEPDTDIEVTIRRRSGFENGKWHITLSPEDKPFAIVAEDIAADTNE